MYRSIVDQRDAAPRDARTAGRASGGWAETQARAASTCLQVPIAFRAKSTQLQNWASSAGYSGRATW